MQEIIFWLVLLIIFIAIEVATLGLTTIWFAGGALIAILAAALSAPVFVQIILFFLVALVMLFFTRPIAVKYFNKDRVRTNVESMVGRPAVVIADIDNIHGTGQVSVSGLEWSARSYNEKERIEAGTIVSIMAINGVKLIVRPQPSGSESKDMEKQEKQEEQRPADTKESEA